MLCLFSVLIAAGLILACLTGYVLENYTMQHRMYRGVGEHPRGTQPPYPGGGMENVFWFLQVSDIHVSKFVDPQRVPDFQKFCTETIDVIKPEIVFVTGMTEGRYFVVTPHPKIFPLELDMGHIL